MQADCNADLGTVQCAASPAPCGQARLHVGPTLPVYAAAPAHPTDCCCWHLTSEMMAVTWPEPFQPLHSISTTQFRK